MSRPERIDSLMETAFIWARRSTCHRLHVGAVAHRDGRILVQGYNGAPTGLPHCDYPHGPEECLAVHAEQNAISWAARTGVALEGADWVVTDQPCINCAKSLINTGLKSVIYYRAYRLQDGVELLTEAGVEVFPWMRPALPHDMISL